MPRFFVSPSEIGDGTILLTGENARHVSYSLRLAPGDRITVSDEKFVYCCELTRFTEETAEAKILSVSESDTEPPVSIHLYQALPKGDKLDFIIQKAVECGVSDITPFESSRCVVHRKPETEERKTERRSKIAREAAQQCGRGVIPPVHPAVNFCDMLESASKADLSLFCYEAETAVTLKQALDDAMPVLSGATSAGRIPEIAVIIGSEGGFSREEAEEASEHGCRLTGLGRRILRSETASVFVLSCLTYRFEL